MGDDTYYDSLFSAIDYLQDVNYTGEMKFLLAPELASCNGMDAGKFKAVGEHLLGNIVRRSVAAIGMTRRIATAARTLLKRQMAAITSTSAVKWGYRPLRPSVDSVFDSSNTGVGIYTKLDEFLKVDRLIKAESDLLWHLFVTFEMAILAHRGDSDFPREASYLLHHTDLNWMLKNLIKYCFVNIFRFASSFKGIFSGK